MIIQYPEATIYEIKAAINAILATHPDFTLVPGPLYHGGIEMGVESVAYVQNKFGTVWCLSGSMGIVFYNTWRERKAGGSTVIGTYAPHHFFSDLQVDPDNRTITLVKRVLK